MISAPYNVLMSPRSRCFFRQLLLRAKNFQAKLVEIQYTVAARGSNANREAAYFASRAKQGLECL